MPTDQARVIDRAGLDALIAGLAERGYRVIGPVVRDGAIVHEDVRGTGDLPEGWGDEQEGGTYRLHRREDGALFGFASTPQSWKRFLFPPRTLLSGVRRGEDGPEVHAPPRDAERFAFLGVRACDLAAIEVQDRTFLREGLEDPTYAARRGAAFLVAVNCGAPSATCFCVSMDTGPRAERGYDLALTEILDEGGHRFLLEVGSERGAEVASSLPGRQAAAEDVAASDAVTAACAEGMGRHMETDGIKDLLYRNLDHPRWDDVAQRCLACTNCTMVCPTCFCSTVEETTDLVGDSERVRRWDSCFTLGHSEMGGGTVRTSNRSRYRQWMTHKLATWIDQFGVSGCVGCGRCIAWCPVGIDITEEVRAIRESEGG